jgi:hypothetical protein
VSKNEACYTCQCKWYEDPDAVKNVYIFNYLPRKWLIAKGMIQSGEGKAIERMQVDDDDDDDDDDRISVEEQPENVALWKRPRENSDDCSRRQRAREGTTASSQERRQDTREQEEVEAVLNSPNALRERETAPRQQELARAGDDITSRQYRAALVEDILDILEQKARLKSITKEGVRAKEEVSVKQKGGEKHGINHFIDLTLDSDTDDLPVQQNGESIVLSDDEE